MIMGPNVAAMYKATNTQPRCGKAHRGKGSGWAVRESWGGTLMRAPDGHRPTHALQCLPTPIGCMFKASRHRTTRLSMPAARVSCGAKAALERKEPPPMPSSPHTRSAASDSISFALNGEITTVRHIAPTKMVLNFLREDLGKT